MALSQPLRAFPHTYCDRSMQDVKGWNRSLSL